MSKVKTITFTASTKTVPSPAKATPLSSTSILCTEFEVEMASGNSGSVFIGDENVNSTDYVARAAGERWSFSADDLPGETRFFDLNKIYFTGTAGDSLKVQYKRNT